MNFDKAFDVLVGHEGGYTDDPKDRGNWTTGVVGKGQLKGTKYGISAMAYPNEDIKSLTLDRAKVIYRADFWDKVLADQLPESVRFDLFDVAVNSGVTRAIKFLQRAVGAAEDGRIGPDTVRRACAMDSQMLDKRLSGIRLLFLCDVDTFPSYGKGWVRRVANNLMID